MADGLDAGKIYIIDATKYNADGNAIDLSGSTQGVDYIEFDIPDTIQEKFSAPGIRIKPYYGGKSHVLKDGISVYTYNFRVSLVAGTTQSCATQRTMVRRYFNIHKETGSDKSYLYMRHGTGANDFEIWYDATQNAREFMEGEWVGGAFNWTMAGDENLRSEGSITFRSSYST